MGQKIQIRRGNEVNLPVLANGEMALTIDTKNVFIGTPSGNVQVGLTTDDATKILEQTEYKTYKTNKDANAIFTTIEHKRADGTLAIKSVLNGGTSPQYTTRTVTYYAADGTTVDKTTTLTLTYDADGTLISEA